MREDIILKKLEAKHTDVFNNGVHIKAINDFAKENGLKSEIRKGLTPEDLCRIIDEDIPVIVLLQAWRDIESPSDWKDDYRDGHYVVGIGFSDDKIIFEDPSSFTRTYLPFDELKDRWHAISDNEEDDPETVAILIKGTPKYKRNKIVHMD
jgi:hypothetical protein